MPFNAASAAHSPGQERDAYYMLLRILHFVPGAILVQGLQHLLQLGASQQDAQGLHRHPVSTHTRQLSSGPSINLQPHHTPTLIRTVNKPPAWGGTVAQAVAPTTFGLDAHGGHGFESDPMSFLLSTPQLFSLSFPVPLFTKLSIKSPKINL